MDREASGKAPEGIGLVGVTASGIEAPMCEHAGLPLFGSDKPVADTSATGLAEAS